MTDQIGTVRARSERDARKAFIAGLRVFRAHKAGVVLTALWLLVFSLPSPWGGPPPARASASPPDNPQAGRPARPARKRKRDRAPRPPRYVPSQDRLTPADATSKDRALAQSAGNRRSAATSSVPRRFAGSTAGNRGPAPAGADSRDSGRSRHQAGDIRRQ